MDHTPMQLAIETGVAPLLADPPVAAPGDHGEVFTRRWVVDLILDLAGYTPERDLGATSAVEPACGKGAFLLPMVERLADSCIAHGRDLSATDGAIRAYDLLPRNVEASRLAVAHSLQRRGVPAESAVRLATRWVVRADFLLENESGLTADFVLGNPPYIRLENVPRDRGAAYRNACGTMRGRSDVFVGFIERGLQMLRDGAALGFIVADRWMRNQYGAGLRGMVSDAFSVESLIQLHDVDAFEDRVSAYPAIVVIRRARQGGAVIAETNRHFGERDARSLREWIAAKSGSNMRSPGVAAAQLQGWFRGRASWPAGSPEELALVADLEARFPPLQDHETETRVGIGVATGCDSVYLTQDPDLVEPDRLLPLVMAHDTTTGTVRWSGTYLVSPWQDGALVDLANYPRLGSYLTAHRQAVRARHVARRNASAWYRTIDRVEPGLDRRAKLLVPDLKASIHPVLEDGRLYPHHNLYFVTSGKWDLDVLGGLLLSDVANLFVGAYCVKMRGGCYRFQAQYLRRIRLPRLDSLRRGEKRALARAFAERDVETATEIACRLYGIAELPKSRRIRVPQLHGYDGQP